MNHQKSFGLTGNALKLIAVISMMIDHIAAALLPVIIENPDAALNIFDYMSSDQLMRLANAFRIIGRLAFPIFMYLLVQGFLHTGDRKKYAVRLLLFAFISEIPFDLAFFGTPFYFGHQNIYFTLVIGLIVLMLLERYETVPIKQMAALLAGCIAALVLRTDYDMGGVLMMAALYLLRDDKIKMAVIGGVLAYLNNSGMAYMGIGAVLAFVPIVLYNGDRGRINLKYFFYWFYPVHLVILYLAGRLLFL